MNLLLLSSFIKTEQCMNVVEIVVLQVIKDETRGGQKKAWYSKNAMKE